MVTPSSAFVFCRIADEDASVVGQPSALFSGGVHPVA
jgi:hypothetical protein